MFSAVATYAIYLMIGVPFAVWAGRSTFARARQRQGYPGNASALWLVVVPAMVIAYGVIRGFDIGQTGRGAWRDEWGEVLFLMAPASAGMIVGFLLGWRRGASTPPLPLGELESDHAQAGIAEPSEPRLDS